MVYSTMLLLEIVTCDRFKETDSQLSAGYGSAIQLVLNS